MIPSGPYGRVKAGLVTFPALAPSMESSSGADPCLLGHTGPARLT